MEPHLLMMNAKDLGVTLMVGNDGLVVMTGIEGIDTWLKRWEAGETDEDRRYYRELVAKLGGVPGSRKVDIAEANGTLRRVSNPWGDPGGWR